MKKKIKEKKGVSKGYPPRRLDIFFGKKRYVTRNRAAIEAKKKQKKTNPWTPKVALRPSGVLLVLFKNTTS